MFVAEVFGEDASVAIAEPLGSTTPGDLDTTSFDKSIVSDTLDVQGHDSSGESLDCACRYSVDLKAHFEATKQ